MALPENKVTIGDGSNGIRMYEGETVYAVNPKDNRKTVLGILRFTESGTPYLSDLPFVDSEWRDSALAPHVIRK